MVRSHTLHCLDTAGIAADRSIWEITPGRLLTFFAKSMVAFFQIHGDDAFRKDVSVKMDNSSALGIESSALRDVGWMSSVPVASLFAMVCMTVSSLRMVKGEQREVATVVSCSALFWWCAWVSSVLLNVSRFTAAYC